MCNPFLDLWLTPHLCPEYSSVVVPGSGFLGLAQGNFLFASTSNHNNPTSNIFTRAQPNREMFWCSEALLAVPKVMEFFIFLFYWLFLFILFYFIILYCILFYDFYTHSTGPHFSIY